MQVSIYLIYIFKVCLFVCMSHHTSGTPEPIMQYILIGELARNVLCLVIKF